MAFSGYLSVPRLSLFSLLSLWGFGQRVQSNGWCTGYPLEQRDWSGLAATGNGQGRASVLGILLFEALLWCCVESGWKMCITGLHSKKGLHHYITSSAG